MSFLSGTPWLTAEGLTVGYGDALLPPIDFTMGPGELWTVLGRNGSGKSTLLRTLLGFIAARGGTVQTRADTKISYIAQRYDRFITKPSRVRDMVRGGCDEGWSFLMPALSPAAARRAEQSMVAMDLTHLQQRQFSRLSEGQKQRVLLARALASGANVLVLDEPTSAMDILGESAFLATLVALCRKRGIAVLLVGHHTAVLAKHATHIMALDSDEGWVATGTAQNVAADPRVQRLYGRLPVGTANGHSPLPTPPPPRETAP